MNLNIPLIFTQKERKLYVINTCIEACHLATGFAATAGTDHGVLDRAAPPSIAGARPVVHHRKVGLLQLGGQLTSSWTTQREHSV